MARVPEWHQNGCVVNAYDALGLRISSVAKWGEGKDFPAVLVSDIQQVDTQRSGNPGSPAEGARHRLA